jgi:hypothetical protein
MGWPQRSLRRRRRGYASPGSAAAGRWSEPRLPRRRSSPRGLLGTAQPASAGEGVLLAMLLAGSAGLLMLGFGMLGLSRLAAYVRPG